MYPLAFTKADGTIYICTVYQNNFGNKSVYSTAKIKYVISLL